jgi:hypothetical protein
VKKKVGWVSTSLKGAQFGLDTTRAASAGITCREGITELTEPHG